MSEPEELSTGILVSVDMTCEALTSRLADALGGRTYPPETNFNIDLADLDMSVCRQPDWDMREEWPFVIEIESKNKRWSTKEMAEAVTRVLKVLWHLGAKTEATCTYDALLPQEEPPSE